MKPTTLEAYQLLHQGIEAFARAEQAGMRIDVDYCEKQRKHLTRKVARLEGKFELTNLAKQWGHVYGAKKNIHSDHQLRNILYNIRKLTPPKTTTSGAGSVDEDALTQLDVLGIDILIEIRKLIRTRDTYLLAFIREQVNGYVHPFLNLHLVQTYRSSSDGPNFQNIPARNEDMRQATRRAIFPREGHQLLTVDFQGIEVRVSQCYHNDPTMLEYIQDPKSDMHGDMAQQIFFLEDFSKKEPSHDVLRNAAKNGFVFPQFYGDYYANNAENLACRWGQLPKGAWKGGQGIKMPDGKLSDHLIAAGISSYNQFEKHIREVEEDFWDRRFKVYQQWKDEWWEEYQNKGYLDMLTGFRCSGVMDKNQVINTPIQGAAFHCLLWTFIELDRIQQEEEWRSRLILQIHDELIIDVHPDECDHVATTVRRVACEDLPEAWDWIIVPLDVDADLCEVDASWAEKKPYAFAA